MHKYVIKSTSIEHGNILRLVLTPKRPKDALNYQPGQYAAIGFRRSGRPSPIRCFSLVSSPYNSSELEFAIRVRGMFTESLAELPIGTSVRIQGPYGNFTIDQHYDTNTIFLAGGIGITPFMSMIRASTDSSLPNRLFLLYSNQRQGLIPFHDELVDHEQRNPLFGSVFFVTKGTVAKQPGTRLISGRISKNHLIQLTGGKLDSCTYFICGPKAFTRQYQKLLAGNGVSRDRIVIEDFSTSTSLRAALLPRDRSTRLTYAIATVAIALSAVLIGALDLVRYVPAKMQVDALVTQTHHPVETNTRLAPESAPAQSVQTQATPTPTTTPVTTPAPVATAPSTTTTPAPVQTPTPTTTQTYQPPTTSVS